MHSLLLCELITTFSPFVVSAAVDVCVSSQLILLVAVARTHLHSYELSLHKVVCEQKEMGGTRLVTAVIT